MNEKAWARGEVNVSGIRRRKNATSFSPLLNSLANLPSSLPPPLWPDKKVVGSFSVQPSHTIAASSVQQYSDTGERTTPLSHNNRHPHQLATKKCNIHLKNVKHWPKPTRYKIVHTQLFCQVFCVLYCAVCRSIYKGKLSVVFMCRRARARVFVCFCLTISKVWTTIIATTGCASFLVFCRWSDHKLPDLLVLFLWILGFS